MGQKGLRKMLFLLKSSKDIHTVYCDWCLTCCTLTETITEVHCCKEAHVYSFVLTHLAYIHIWLLTLTTLNIDNLFDLLFTHLDFRFHPQLVLYMLHPIVCVLLC